MRTDEPTACLEEFNDFFVYATAAVIVFPALFFPSADPTTSILASFAAFGAAFVARPIGGMLFGYLGDRIGRTRVLVYTLMTCCGSAST